MLMLLLIATLQASVLEHPDVVVASTNTTHPEYPFTIVGSVRNAGDEAVTVNLVTVWYVNRDVDGCPTDVATPASRNAKRMQVEPGREILVGGIARPGEGPADRVWSHAIFREYQDNLQGGRVRVLERPQSFCFLVEDVSTEGCPPPCIAAAAEFRAFTRLANTPPRILAVEVPERVAPGGRSVLIARAADEDTKPGPDPVSISWTIGTEVLEGPTVQYTWGPPGEYEVIVRVTDGFDTVQEVRTVTVEAGAGGDDGDRGTPAPALAMLLLAAAVVARRRRVNRPL